MANQTGSSSASTYWLPPTGDEEAIRQQWSQALAYLLPSLGMMSQYTDPSLYGNYTGIVGGQSQQALDQVQAQQQIDQLIQQANAARQSGDVQTAQQYEDQIAKLPGGQTALTNNQLYLNTMAMSRGELPQLSQEAQNQITSIGQGYETAGLNDVSRAREQANRQWQQNTAQRGLQPGDTPSQAAWGPVEAELARQTSQVGAGRGALEAQTRLQFAQQMPTNAAQLATFQQALQTAAQQNRTQLATASAQPYQNMFSSVNTAGNAYSPFTQQLQNQRTGQTSTSSQYQASVPWTSALQSVGTGLKGVSESWPYLEQMGKAIASWF